MMELNSIFFEFEDNKLIITSLGDNPYESILASMSNYIGNKRYAVSYNSFLKQCNSKKELFDKVDFFNSIENRTNPLTKFDSENYIIYKVNKDDKELLKIFNTDKNIKEHIIRAENYMILIPKSYLNEFLKRLKTYGYIV